MGLGPGGICAWMRFLRMECVEDWWKQGWYPARRTGKEQASLFSRHSTFCSDAPFLAALAKLRYAVAVGGHQQDLSGCRRCSVPLGAAAGDLSFELRPLLRERALVCALAVYPGTHCGDWSHLLGAG